MESEQSVIHDTVTLETLRDRGHSELPENIRVEAPYRKHVFWVPRRDSAHTLVARIRARITVVGECNFGTDCGMGGNFFYGGLLETPEGYFQIDKPYDLSTHRLQCGHDSRTYDLILRDGLIACSSTRPIVIHAHEDIDIDYTLEDKPAESAN